MADLDKVIKGLECCLANEHNSCPYESTDEGIDKVTSCTTYLMQDALDLLKAQQPRVMTLEEACRDIEIWYESINSASGYGDLCYDANTDLAIYTPHGIKGVKEYDYGKTWRCWTSRPDEKVKGETPWQK